MKELSIVFLQGNHHMINDNDRFDIDAQAYAISLRINSAHPLVHRDFVS